MVDISTVNGILNQLVTRGPNCSHSAWVDHLVRIGDRRLMRIPGHQLSFSRDDMSGRGHQLWWVRCQVLFSCYVGVKILRNTEDPLKITIFPTEVGIWEVMSLTQPCFFIAGHSCASPPAATKTLKARKLRCHPVPSLIFFGPKKDR